MDTNNWITNAVLIGFIALLICNSLDMGLNGGEAFLLFFVVTSFIQWFFYFCKLERRGKN